MEFPAKRTVFKVGGAGPGAGTFGEQSGEPGLPPNQTGEDPGALERAPEHKAVADHTGEPDPAPDVPASKPARRACRRKHPRYGVPLIGPAGRAVRRSIRR